MVGRRISRLKVTASADPQERLLGVVPQSDLLTMIQVLSEPRLLGVLSSEDLPEEQVRGLGQHLLLPPSARRPLHPLLSRSAAIHAIEVEDYHGKTCAVSQVSRLAAEHGLRRRALGNLEVALDEMLLNALYDAPVDEHGAPRYGGCSREERVAIKAPCHERALVRCAGDEHRYVVAVRDRFGSLRRQTVLSYLSRCAQAQAQRISPVQSKAGGAGVGLYLITTAANELLFRLAQGSLTEVVFVASMNPRDASRGLRALLIEETGQRT